MEGERKKKKSFWKKLKKRWNQVIDFVSNLIFVSDTETAPKDKTPKEPAPEKTEHKRTVKSEQKNTPEYKTNVASKRESALMRKRRVGKLSKKEIREIEDAGERLWQTDPLFYKKKKPWFVRFLRGIGSFLLFCIVTGGILAVLCAGITATVVYSYSDPEMIDALSDQDMALSSTMYVVGENGEYQEYVTFSSSEFRRWVSIYDIPDCVKRALIDTEDHRFYNHPGVDPITTVKAIINYAFSKVTHSGSHVAGGSSITQQLVKNITGDSGNSVDRKIREALRSLYLERVYSKEQILEYYLNIVYFGNGCYGIGTASQKYFGKAPSELNTLEAAAIIGITKNPGYYEPIHYPDGNRQRRNNVLYNMYKEGSISREEFDLYYNDPEDATAHNAAVVKWYEEGKITAEQYDLYYWYEEDRDPETGKWPDLLVLAEKVADTTNWSYATDTVFEAVVADLMSTYGYTRQRALNKLYTGGLKIYSTFDLEIQQIMEDYLSDVANYEGTTIKNYEKETVLVAEKTDASGEVTPEHNVYPQVAMLIMNPENGDMLGVVGGRGVKTGKLGLNRVTSTVRQSGSSIKPLSVYGYAIENNLVTLATPIDDFPIDILPVMDPETGEQKIEQVEQPVLDPVTGEQMTDPVTGLPMTTLVDTPVFTGWPNNFARTYNGLTTVYRALSNSYNTTSLRVLDLVGVRTSYEFAKTMLGLHSLVSADIARAPLAIGAQTYGVTVQEMTAGFSAYANEGVYVAPRCYTKVENYLGETVLEKEVESRIVFSEQTAYLMTTILLRVTSITANGRATVVSGIETAGKTGTSENLKDRWFIGYTPYYLGGIWWGYDENYATTVDVAYQCYLWGGVMNEVHKAKGYTTGSFVAPAGLKQVTYCQDSGKLPCEYCALDPRGSRLATNYFKEGTEPTEICDMHHALYVCDVSGQIAHDNCPSAHLAVFVDYVRSFGLEIEVAGAQYLCPRLTEDMVLTNDKILPVYTFMLDEGMYPGVPQGSLTATKTVRYPNCLCSVHKAYDDPHIFGAKVDRSVHTDPTPTDSGGAE